MKTKQTILAIIMLFSVISLKGQITWNAGSFTCTTPDTNVVCNLNSTYIFTCTIINNSCCNSVTCNQVIDSVFALPTGWYVTMCNPNGCLPVGTTQDAFVLPPSGSLTAKFEIHSNSNSGAVKVKVRFEDAANGRNMVSFHIVGTIATGIDDNVGVTNSISQNFPNPFSGSTVIRYNTKQLVTKLIITDVQGKTIHQYSLNNSSGEVHVTENLSHGMYFYAIYSGDVLLERKKIIAQ